MTRLTIPAPREATAKTKCRRRHQREITMVTSVTPRGPDGHKLASAGVRDALRYIALVHDRKVFRCTTDTDHRWAAARQGANSPAARGYGYGGYGRGRGRGGARARRGDVRAAVLALLAERPMHGYEMIKEIEERTDGAWTPSAGSIYPTLQMLEDEGLISGQETEGKRRFTLTDSGRAEQESRSSEQHALGRGPRRGRPRAVPAARVGPQAAPLDRPGLPRRPTRTSSGGSASCSTRRGAGSTRSSPRRAEPDAAIMPPR